MATQKTILFVSLIILITGLCGTAEATVYAGGSNPNVVYRYLGENSWETVSQELGGAVLCLCEYEGYLYAGTKLGQVWRYDGDPSWTLVGDNLDDQVCSLIVFRENLYAGTAWNGGKLYRYDGDGNWPNVINFTGWSGFRCMYVWNDILYLGDIGYDNIGHYDGNSFTPDAYLNGSCIWDFELYDSNLYASAYYGRLHRSSDGNTWTTIRDYQDYDSWELETFQGYLYVSTGPNLERYDGNNFSLIWTEPNGYEIISMTNAVDTLIFGTGAEAGYHGGSGIGRIYTYDGNTIHSISGNMGDGIQSLYAGIEINLTKTDDVSGCVGPLGTITYTIDYNNLNGTIDDVSIIDSLPDEVGFLSASDGGGYNPGSHTVTWNMGTLEPNESGFVTLTVGMRHAEANSTIINECEAKSGEQVLATAEESTFVCPRPCDVNLTKIDDVNAGDCVGPGREITYTIDCYSNCPGINDVNIVDYLPAEVDFNSASNGGLYDSNSHTVTWHIDTLHPGYFGPVTLTVIVRPCIEPNSTITNEGKIIIGGIIYDTAYEGTPVCPNYPTLTKEDNVSGCVLPDVNITYNICYAANGYGDTNVKIDDNLPPEVNFVSADSNGVYDPCSRTVRWNIGTLEPDESGCVTLTVKVKPCIEPSSTIINQCTMTGDCIHDINAYENTPVCPNYPTLTKVDDVGGCVSPGETISYSICYAANGYGDTGVIIDDNLPPEVNFVSATGDWQYNSGTVTWDIGTLEPNELGCVTLTVKVNTMAVPDSVITNHCEMTGDCIHGITAYENTPVCCRPPDTGAEVINIDLNGYNDNNAPPAGTVAAYDDGINQWNVYYGGWGIAMGSPRSADLADYDEPCMPSTYAKQVWIGDANQGSRGYEWGCGLMDDGFIKDGNLPPATGDPNIRLWGVDAYQGKFDIYVYGSSDGNFTLDINDNANYHNIEKHVSGGFDGNFVENKNYVIFRCIPIYCPNYVTITYSGDLDALQLVSAKRPVAIYLDPNLPAKEYDVAFETNARDGEGQHFGPDICPPDTFSSYGYVVYLDNGEYMKYDITMNDVNEGEYAIYAAVDVRDYDADFLEVSLDDIMLGTLSAPFTPPPPVTLNETNRVYVNIFEGSHTFKWRLTDMAYFNLAYFVFERVGPINISDCNDIYMYGFNYEGDLDGDCHVDFNDLKVITDDWLDCYSPPDSNSYADEVLADNPVLYLRFEQFPLVDSSGRDCWVGSSPLAKVEKAVGAMGKAIHLNGGWVAAANSLAEPCLPTQYGNQYAFTPDGNSDITFEFWTMTPLPDLVDTWAELFNDCNTIETIGYDEDPVYRPCATRGDIKMKMALADTDGTDPYAYTDEGAWIADTNWHHHVVIWDERPEIDELNVRWYTDNIEYKNETYTGITARGWRLNSGPAMDHLIIGGLGSRDNFSPGPGVAYREYMDEFAVYAGILPLDRIRAHYLAWQPRSCEELWDRGFGGSVAGDMDENCEVDFEDFAKLALDWATYADPNDPNSWNY